MSSNTPADAGKDRLGIKGAGSGVLQGWKAGQRTWLQLLMAQNL
ncbi:MAG: hypothetical protein ACPHRC_04555 [Candidatus Puniceispirillales bacterium]